jgi:2-phosphosulfolactate phosphatase
VKPRGMEIKFASLEACGAATDTVVAVDVCRAFTTAAYAFAAGAREIIPVGRVEEALALREQMPGALVMGEVGGLPVEGFDFGNSPNELLGVDLAGRCMIQRTSAGTQGVVRSKRAQTLLASSFVCAGATARCIRQLAPESVTFVITGMRPDRGAEEDAACADYIAALLDGQAPDVEPFLNRARNWLLQYRQAGSTRLKQLALDLERCLEVDRFDFAMLVRRRDGLPVIVGCNLQCTELDFTMH